MIKKGNLMVYNKQVNMLIMSSYIKIKKEEENHYSPVSLTKRAALNNLKII